MDVTSSCGLALARLAHLTIPPVHHLLSARQMNGLAASQSTLAPSTLCKFILSPFLTSFLPIQVNSLVTDRVLLQRSLEQLRGELEEERRRREEAEERSARLGREVSQAKEKVEEFERRLREEGMSSSGVGSIHSDQDSGKHSDNSLVISRYH